MLDFGLPDRLLLFKTDAVVEGIHFQSDAPPEKIGHKALGRCLSDIAAMAGTPGAALVTLALPLKFDPGFVEAIYAGLNALARKHDVAIVGGETTANPERLLISVALLGHVPRGAPFPVVEEHDLPGVVGQAVQHLREHLALFPLEERFRGCGAAVRKEGQIHGAGRRPAAFPAPLP